MSIAEPLPETPWGTANWQDYVNNWRELDAEWLMNRTVLRFQSSAERDNKLTAPTTGQVIFNNNPGGGESPRLELRISTQWIPYKPLPIYMVKGEDSTNQVLLSHASAGGKGVSFTPTAVNVTANFSVLGGVFAADPAGISFKTGTKTAKFTTDATKLISDSPLSVQGLTTTTLTATSVSTPTITGVTSLTTGSITLSGTLTGGTINGTGGTISGVKFGTEAVGSVDGAGGYYSQNGVFYGDATSAVMRRKVPGGAWGSTYFQVDDGSAWVWGGYLRITGSRGIAWHRGSDGSPSAWISPTIYSATDPGAANYPDGTLWIS